METQSSELQRVAEEADRNEYRLSAWRKRLAHYQHRRGHWLRRIATQNLKDACRWCPRGLATDWIDDQINKRNRAVIGRLSLSAYLSDRDDATRDSATMAEWETAARAGVRPAQRAADALADYDARCGRLDIFRSQAA